MQFKMNDLIWTIKYATESEVRERIGDKNTESYYYGCATLSMQEILINKDVSVERQRKTLYHELMHAYIASYMFEGLSFDEEALCDVSAKSHDMINRIASAFFESE